MADMICHKVYELLMSILRYSMAWCGMIMVRLWYGVMCYGMV